MARSQWPVVLYALVDLLRAQSGFRAPLTPSTTSSESSVLVLDGPEHMLTADQGALLLVIGGSIDDPKASGNAQQANGPIGNRARDETGTVLCQAIAQIGGVNLSVPRLATSVPQDTWRSLTLAAFAIVGTVEDVLRLDPTAGITTPLRRMECQVGQIDAPDRYLTSTGGAVSVLFGIDYLTRI